VVRAGALLHVECPHPSPELTAQLLEKWYRRRANAYLPRRVFELAAELNVLPSRVTIRGQRSRWGSCSASAAISLNWRLMMLDAELTHYVLVHELCHLRHLNHSPAFWEMVHSVVPDARRQRRRLRDAPTEFRF
jgi:predicted metal-dependent hydrolase